MSTEEIKTVTCYGCPHAVCFVKAHLVDGELVAVTPDPEKPCVDDCPRGFLDYDGRAGIEYHYMKNRMNYPLKRAGKRGENRWERISWDQALDEIADKLQGFKDKYGPNSVMLATGTAHHSDNNWAPWRWMVGFRTMNKIGNEQICYGPQMITSEQTFGWPMSPYPVPGNDPKVMVIVGNMHESFLHLWKIIEPQRAGGECKMISVDPRATDAARTANIWLQVRPGSDIALWMCWIRTIMKEGWYDKEFVEDWTNGPLLVRTDTQKILRGGELADGVAEDSFVVWNTATDGPAIWDADDRKYLEEGVKQALAGEYKVKLKSGETVECKTAWTLLGEQVEEWTPEKAEEFTWVPKDKILEACEMYATNKPGQLLAATHVYDSYAPGSSAVWRCVAILRAMHGSIDKCECLTGCYDTNKMVSIYEMELKPDEAFSEEEKKQQPTSEHFRALTYHGYDLRAKYEKKQWGVATNAMWSNQTHHHIMWRDLIAESPDRPRAMIMSGTNPLLKYGNVKMVYEAMKKLELIVAFEFVLTPSAQLADYVLPMSDWFERAEIGPSTPSDIFNVIHANGPAMEPEYERRSDYDAFKGLADRLGFGEDWPWKDLTECYNWRCKGLLEEHGCKDMNEFGDKVGFDYPTPIFEQYKIKKGFATPTGKVELWSVHLETLGYEPLPNFCEPVISPYSTPELAEDYPLILIGVHRHLPQYHTMFFEVPSLRRMCPDPFMEIHPATARRLDPPVTDGDWVWVETRIGRIKQRAKLTFGINPGVVNTSHHWWFPEQPGEEPYLHGVWQSNTNVITEDDPELCDPVFGSWPLTSLLCRVYKATDASHLEEDRTF